MSEELAGLIRERNDARFAFTRARFTRDAAAVYYDSVVDEEASVTKAAWDSFTAMQQALDRAVDWVDAASSALIDYLLEGGGRRDPDRGTR